MFVTPCLPAWRLFLFDSFESGLYSFLPSIVDLNLQLVPHRRAEFTSVSASVNIVASISPSIPSIVDFICTAIEAASLL
jgi:hypothetical protein